VGRHEASRLDKVGFLLTMVIHMTIVIKMVI